MTPPDAPRQRPAASRDSAATAAPVFFRNAAEFRRWLAKHAATATELVVGYRTVASGLPSMTWPESVDEALCVGWIDGVRKNVDATRYQIRFTPRKPGSVWSAVNIAKVEKLVAEGRMQPAGLAAFERRLAHRSKIYAYEQPAVAALTAAEVKAFRRDTAAWAYFEAAPAGYRKRMLHWVCGAKQAQTREKRLAVLVVACGEGRRL